MGFGGWMSRAESAGLFRFRPAHGTADGQYVPHRELRDFHTCIIQRCGLKIWSILLLNDCNRPKWDCGVANQRLWEVGLDREICFSIKDSDLRFLTTG
jgi:hypothetical protein